MALGILKEHLINAVAAATVVGGGAMVLDAKVNLARQDERIIRIEKLSDQMEDLSVELSATRVDLAAVKAVQERTK